MSLSLLDRLDSAFLNVVQSLVTHFDALGDLSEIGFIYYVRAREGEELVL